MSVSDTFALNAQPAAGRSNLVPLGGNGIVAPQSMYEVQATLAGDGSGGTNSITITRDPRWQSIMTLANGNVTGAAAGIEVMFEMRNSDNGGPFARGFGNAVPIASISSLSTCVWNPPPIMTIDTWTLTTANTTGDSMFFNAWFYNFDVRILELSPMWKILMNLPRAGLMDSFSA